MAKSLEVFLTAIDNAEERQDYQMLSKLNENLASLYVEQKEFEQALYFYEKVKLANRKLGDELISAQTFSNLANLNAEIGDFKKAMFNVNQSISTFEKLQNKDWLAFSYTIKGNIYLKEKKSKWAIYWFDQAKSLYNDLDDKRSEISLYDGYAKVYYELELDSLSEYYALKGFDIAKEITSLEGQKTSAENLYKVYKRKNNQKLHYIIMRFTKKLMTH